jgi:hypothetical protein
MNFPNKFRTQTVAATLCLVTTLLVGCGEARPLWRDQKLASGKQVKITSVYLAWGAEHDERFPNQDCFALQFVSAEPDAASPKREQEAWEVFELIRPVSEQWEFKSASLLGFRTIQRGGDYDLFVFKRADDGNWSLTLSDVGHRSKRRNKAP